MKICKECARLAAEYGNSNGYIIAAYAVDHPWFSTDGHFVFQREGEDLDIVRLCEAKLRKDSTDETV